MRYNLWFTADSMKVIWSFCRIKFCIVLSVSYSLSSNFIYDGPIATFALSSARSYPFEAITDDDKHAGPLYGEYLYNYSTRFCLWCFSVILFLCLTFHPVPQPSAATIHPHSPVQQPTNTSMNAPNPTLAREDDQRIRSSSRRPYDFKWAAHEQSGSELAQPYEPTSSRYQGTRERDRTLDAGVPTYHSLAVQDSLQERGYVPVPQSVYAQTASMWIFTLPYLANHFKRFVNCDTQTSCGRITTTTMGITNSFPSSISTAAIPQPISISRPIPKPISIPTLPTPSICLSIHNPIHTYKPLNNCCSPRTHISSTTTTPPLPQSFQFRPTPIPQLRLQPAPTNLHQSALSHTSNCRQCNYRLHYPILLTTNHSGEHPTSPHNPRSKRHSDPSHRPAATPFQDTPRPIQLYQRALRELHCDGMDELTTADGARGTGEGIRGGGEGEICRRLGAGYVGVERKAVCREGAGLQETG